MPVGTGFLPLATVEGVSMQGLPQYRTTVFMARDIIKLSRIIAC